MPGREAERFLLASSLRMRVPVSLLTLYTFLACNGADLPTLVDKSLPFPGIQPNHPVHDPTTCLNRMGNFGNNVQCSRFYVVIYSFLVK